MATTITQFTGGHNGSGGAPVDREDTVAITGTAGAGEWLQVITVGGADGAGLDQTVLSDDVSGSTGWIEDFDFVEGAGSDAIRVIGWRKQTVGGETTVVATWPGACNHAIVGCWAHDLTQPTMYLIDAGGALFDPPFMRFTAGPPLIQTDHETYVASMGFGRAGASLANFESPPSPPAEGGSGTVISSAVGAISHYNDDESTNSTADTLVYQLQPTQSAVMCWYGFTDEVEAVHFFGEASVVDATGELEVSGEAVDLAGAASPISAEGRLTITGGEVDLAGEAAVVSATGRLRSPTPQPTPDPAPSNVLGCGVYEVFGFTRGLGFIVGNLEFDSIQWGRQLDAVSTATLTIDGVSNLGALERCCQVLGELEPFEHELGIYRAIPGTNIKKRVWSGPITRMRFPSEEAIIEAFDLSGWLTRRTLHANHNYVQTDLINMWVGWVQDAMSVENSAGVYPVVVALSGILGDRLTTIVDHSYASDAIAEIATTGIDWTTVDRIMRAGPVLPQPAFDAVASLPLLIDESFRVAPEIIVDGLDGANCWFVQGGSNGPAGAAIFGEYGPAFAATDDHVAQPAAPDFAEIEDQYGRLEQMTSETRILDQPSIDQAAQTRYALGKRLVPFITGGALLPTAPLPIDLIIPGTLCRVKLARACKPVDATMRIKSLAVTAQSDGSEDVNIGLEPLGSVAPGG